MNSVEEYKTKWDNTKLQVDRTHFIDVLSNSNSKEVRAYMYTAKTKRVLVYVSEFTKKYPLDIVWEAFKDCIALVPMYDSFVENK